MNPLRAAIALYRLRADWLGEGGEPVPLTHSQQRSLVCLKCPKNQPNPIMEKALRPVLAKLLRLQAQMQPEGNVVPGLHICSACDCLLQAKVHVPLKHILATTPLEKLQQESPRCWILCEKESI